MQELTGGLDLPGVQEALAKLTDSGSPEDEPQEES
jgi:hypothetical protein